MSDSIVLWGRDHTALGEVAVRTPGALMALALSRGEEPKSYDYVDPNEDAVTLVRGPRAALAAVADGHGGIGASEAAIKEVRRNARDDPPPADLTADAVVELFLDANEATRAAATEGGEQLDSGTTLAIALVTPDRLQWASFGDSAVFAGDADGVQRLDRPLHRFLGRAMTSGDIRERLSWGTQERPSGAWVVVATDGFTDYLDAAPDRAVRDALAAGDPPAVAERLVRRAFAGGAGDNVAVACIAPTE